jgi:hypothetical protein
MFSTFRDRTLSLWQSALQEAAAQEGEKPMAGLPLGPMRVAGTALAAALLERKPLSAAPDIRHFASFPALARLPAAALSAINGAVSKGWDCSRLAFELAQARAQNDQPKADKLHNLLKFSTCDPGWARTVDAFLRYYLLNKGNIPYRHGGDYVLADLPDKATVALLGDWGTGTDPANDLLKRVAAARPHVVFHLGDIYYSGTRLECERFLHNVTGILPPGTRVYTLSGNHDVYSGGAGYYWLIDQLKQQSSYFCVRNAHWQFLAMDTGRDDFDPFQVDSHAPALTSAEADWHLAKIRAAGGRKTVLLSHHPLFTAFEPIAHQAVNENLHDTFKDVLPDVAAWFWGHEHRLDIYGEYLGLKRGRCVGCSAVPVFEKDTFFDPKFPDVPLLQDPLASGKTVRLGARDGAYNLAYAVMELDGPAAVVSYYQSGADKPLFVEKIP